MDPQDSQKKDIKETIKELIMQKIQQLKLSKEPDYFQILGVSKNASESEIKEAYYKLAKLIHPDLLGKYDLQDMRDQANIAFSGVNEAFQILSDKIKKQKYITGELKVVTPTASHLDKKKKAEEAKIFFHKGQILLQRRGYREAEECFKKAISLDETQSKYYLHLGWAIFQNDEYNEAPRLEEAKKYFERALELSHQDPQPHYYLSLYYKALGDTAMQRRYLHDALSINPKYLDALREVRLLRMRSRKTASGLFRVIKRLFSKK